MSDTESPVSAEEVERPRAPKRLRRFLLRHLPLTVVSLLLLVALVCGCLYLVMSSERFQGLVRERLIAQLEQATGGRVEIAAFHWQLLQLEADADGLVIHGLELPSEPPLGQVERLSARLSLLGLWSPSVKLRDLEIIHPVLHLILYADGTTNMPKLRAPIKSNERPVDAFFDLKAGYLSVERGLVDIDSRATSFDFQNRLAPLDLQAEDLSVQLKYIAAGMQTPEAYRIDAGATDLSLTRNVAHDELKQKPQPVRGYFQATLDLTRNSATLQSLRLTARSADKVSHSLNISGALEDFTHPRWQAKVAGELDARLLDPITGYPFAPEGIARIDLYGAGQGSEFRAEGKIHVDGGSYIGTGVTATGVRLDANVHADPKRLLISSIVARLKQGGQIEGVVDLSPWLKPIPGATTMKAAEPKGEKSKVRREVAPEIPLDKIPVNGKVTANFKDVPLDAILDTVSVPPFQRFGIDSLVNGPSTATWVNGDNNTVGVVGNLTLRPSSHPLAGELGASGVLDATYTQRNGGVDVRKLELHLPQSDLSAHGLLGAYPLTSASSLAIDFHSRNLGEFDAVLRDLGMQRKGRSGVAALPISVAGQGDFHGSWSGSLASPRFAGNLAATQVDLDISALAADEGASPDQRRAVHLDLVNATGSYAADRVVVDHGVLQRGDTKVAFSGALAATKVESAPALRISVLRTTANGRIPSGGPIFDQNSVLNLRLDAEKLSAADVQALTVQKLPFTGLVSAQLQINGPLHVLNGHGWIQLDGGSLYGEPVNRARAQGTVSGKTINFNSILLASGAGQVTGTGSYEWDSKRFTLDAKSAAIDISKLDLVQQKNWGAAGRLGFNLRGAGTIDDPQLQGTAILSGLAVEGEAVGDLELNAHTADQALIYDMRTRMDTAVLTLHGQTALRPEYETQARLEFSQFNIDSLLRLAHVQQLSGESALAGTITLDGPLAHPELLRGEARLKEVETTVAGVHLKSMGDVHATLANERIHLDPLHVTGENTDLHGQGSLALTGSRQLDLAASGSVNLKLVETIDSDIAASGNSTFEVEARGPVKNPTLQGKIDIDNGALSFGDLPNGLSQLRGRLEFNQDRLEVKSLTAMSGGGPLSVGGYLSYQKGLYADLSVTGTGVRIRYPQGISSLADATLHLQGSQTSMLLSGDVLITRFTVSPDLDFAALASQAKSQGTVLPDAPTNHVRLDVRIHSAPQLNFQNAFAKLAGDVDLRLRGTVTTPTLLGRVSVTEGSAVIAGTRYDLQRGDLTFTNPVRIEPAIDLSANARVQDYDITLALHGTLDKPVVNFRSDPPMPESDVVALLALGRTGNEQRLYTQQQEQALSNPTTDALLGGALNATVSSRVQKLFGAGSVKVDPNYLGPFGNSTSRIIVEEQLGRNVTLTYATDVNTTGQQLLQAEIAVNRHVSLLVARDEAGVFSMVVKATRRYR